MKKIVFILIIALIMIHCSIKSNPYRPVEVQEFWLEFLSVLKKGDVNQVRLISTEQGFNSLVEGVKTDGYSNWLKELGKEFSNKESTWEYKSDTLVKISVGKTDVAESIYPTGFNFKKVKGKWQFDLLQGAK